MKKRVILQYQLTPKAKPAHLAMTRGIQKIGLWREAIMATRSRN